jgi:LuxR family maltose regulon positive regulatory protein
MRVVGCASPDRLLDGFTLDQIRSSPHLAAARAWSSLSSGEAEAATYWAAVAEGGAQDGLAIPLVRAATGLDGVAAVRREAASAYGSQQHHSPWRPLACYLEGVAADLMGDREHGRRRLVEGARLAAIDAPALRAMILTQLAQSAHDDGNRSDARRLADEADAVMHDRGLENHPHGAGLDALHAFLLAADGEEANPRTRARAAVDKLAACMHVAPWMRAQVNLLLAHASIQLGDGHSARIHEREARLAALAGAHDAPVILDRLSSLRETLGARPQAQTSRADHLTAAELRVLRFLPTHMSFRQIGEQLHLSRNTVKTQVISAYRKLGVNTRSDAIAHARQTGLLPVETSQLCPACGGRWSE